MNSVQVSALNEHSASILTYTASNEANITSLYKHTASFEKVMLCFFPSDPGDWNSEWHTSPTTKAGFAMVYSVTLHFGCRI